MADKKTRIVLEDLFSSGKIPTQSNFADFIASGINQQDDGLQKATDTALRLQAPVIAGADASAAKDLILFYEKFEDAGAKWRLGTRAGGLEIGRGTQTDFLIDADGRVGIGTNGPKGKLHAVASGGFGGDLSDGTCVPGNVPIIAQSNGTAFGIINGSGRPAFALNIDSEGGTKTARGVPTFHDRYDGDWHQSLALKNGKVGIGTSDPQNRLSVHGGIGFANQNDADKKLYSPADGTLEWFTHDSAGTHGFAVSHQGDQRVFLNTTGNSYLNGGKVGIGIKEPNGTFDVLGKMYVKDNGTIEVPGSKNSFRGMIETWYADNDRYGIGQFNDGITGIYASDTWAPSSIQFGLMTGADSFKAHMKVDHNGRVGIGTLSPLGPLSVGDSSIVGSDGFIVVGKKKSDGGTRHVRIGYDDNWNFTIGDYGHNNNAGTWSSQFAIQWQAPANSLFINASGNVGMGTSNPTKAKLQVEGGVGTQVAGYGYLNRNGASATNTTYTPTYSIWASERMAASEFNATSDERIKNVRGCSDGAIDLDTLLGLQITDYRYKDAIGKGGAPHKKLIAQQVEKVFPQAVSKVTDVIPDIYRQASFTDGWVELETNLKKGERVRLISDETEGVYEVLEATKDKFRTDFEPEGNEVFIYGREVDDFRVVDYDAISMLNVSATQELYKQLRELKEKVKLLESKKYAAAG